MNCVNHADLQAAAFCIRCGRALCSECVHHVKGAVYCEPCLAEFVQGNPAPGFNASGTQSQKHEIAGTNPGVAFALGLIPGVGAIYNGEFLKAAVHVLIFGVLTSLHNFPGNRAAEPLFGMATAAFFFYMAFEAYYTAKKRKLAAEGVVLETPIDRLHQQFEDLKNKELWGGLALVVVGGLFLADNFDLVRFERINQLVWPGILIGLGVWMLKRHQGGSR